MLLASFTTRAQQNFRKHATGKYKTKHSFEARRLEPKRRVNDIHIHIPKKSWQPFLLYKTNVRRASERADDNAQTRVNDRKDLRYTYGAYYTEARVFKQNKSIYDSEEKKNTGSQQWYHLFLFLHRIYQSTWKHGIGVSKQRNDRNGETFPREDAKITYMEDRKGQK